MKVAVIGAGGVGGYFGGKLAKAGFDVTFLARGKHLGALKKNGLQVNSISGSFNVKNFKAVDKIGEIGMSDLILLAVKAWQVSPLREELTRLIHPGTIFLPLQNGVVAAEELAGMIEKKHIAGGLCRIMSKIESPGVINHFGVPFPKIIFGEIFHPSEIPFQQVKSVFDKAGITSEISDDIRAELWRKFMMICVSGLLAVTRTTYGEMRELKETRQMMVQLITEIYELSVKTGIRLEKDIVSKTVGLIDKFPYDSTSSLTRDVWEGKPSEIDYQNGTVLRMGIKNGIDTPVNRFIYNCILPMEIKARNKTPE